jgi:hypothetical protein
MAIDVPNHFFMSSGAAVTGLSFAVMLDTSCWFRHDDEAATGGVTSKTNVFAHNAKSDAGVRSARYGISPIGLPQPDVH